MFENGSVINAGSDMDPKGFTTLKLTKKDPYSKIMPKTSDYTELYKEITKDHLNLAPLDFKSSIL